MDQVGQLGVPTSWLSSYCQREDYSSRKLVLRLLLWWVRWKTCLHNKCLEELIKTGNLIPESRNCVIFGIRKKSKMDQVGQLGVPTSWLSPYCQREDYSSRKLVLRLLLWWVRWKTCLHNKCLEELIKTGNLIPESRNCVIFGIRKKSKMDQVGQLGVPTSWLSSYCQREDYSSRKLVLRLLLWWARWKILVCITSVWRNWSRLQI